MRGARAPSDYVTALHEAVLCYLPAGVELGAVSVDPDRPGVGRYTLAARWWPAKESPRSARLEELVIDPRLVEDPRHFVNGIERWVAGWHVPTHRPRFRRFSRCAARCL